MPRKHPVTCFKLKFDKTTVLLPVTSATTLAVLRATLMDALAHGAGDELSELPKAANDIALWRLLEQDDEEVQEDKWERLTDEKSGADKWGLEEAADVGVSFKNADGKFPSPTVVRPVDEEDLEE